MDTNNLIWLCGGKDALFCLVVKTWSTEIHFCRHLSEALRCLCLEMVLQRGTVLHSHSRTIHVLKQIS